MPTDRHNLQNKEKLATAIGLYILGEISLGKAAGLTGVTRWEMEEILQDAGVELRLGSQTKDNLDEVDVALDVE
ncbi:UPF0175 family protein [Haladaptatus sp. DYF46]|uniref:UPF0175 family protein n=1 Tax=Haladaptatus sp. DYF46 TaxID=2886041 RepID=UPI001E45A5D3|nr:UPF0175 family protein [Haladaptatus sp. DYF46]